jgi:GINS complex subunit 1
MIPKEIEEKLSHWEEEYFKKHSAALKTYMSKVLVDLTVVNSPSLPHLLTFSLTDMRIYTFTYKKGTNLCYQFMSS